MKNHRNQGLHDVDVSGGGSVIAGIVIGGIVLVVSLFVFGERIFSQNERERPKVELVAPEPDPPAK
jgi:hypothetical protein